MLKTFLLLTVCFGILATSECMGLSTRFLHKTINTEQPEELNVAATTETKTERLPAGYYKVNNLPNVEKGCEIRFECKKKLRTAEIPKPCIKFCVKGIECANNKKIAGAPGQCVELNEELVAQEYNACKSDDDDGSTMRIMQVALIDFPCQPGYLPDSRGRCREVW